MTGEAAAEYGARIETGVVTAVQAGGAVVQSRSRPGLVTPPIAGIGDEEYDVGDSVAFFLFDDGTGRVICRMQGGE